MIFWHGNRYMNKVSEQLGLRHKLLLGLAAVSLLVCVGVICCAFYVSQKTEQWRKRAEVDDRRDDAAHVCLVFERFHLAVLDAAFSPEASPVSADLVNELDAGIARLDQLCVADEVDILRQARREWESLRNSIAHLMDGDREDHRIFFEKYIRPGIMRLQEQLSRLDRDAQARWRDEFSKIDQEDRQLRYVFTAVMAADVLLIALIAVLVIRPSLRALKTMTEMITHLQAGQLAQVAASDPSDHRDQLIKGVKQFAADLQDQRKNDDARIKTLELSVQTAINGLADGVVVLNAAGQIEVSNQTAQQLFGLKPGESVESLNLPWLVELLERMHGSSETVVNYPTTIQKFDERGERFFSPRLSVQRQGNEIQGFVLILADTTMVRQIEEAKSSLIATVSHELKTPLTSIQMAIHLLLDGVLGSLNSRQAELMSAARDDTTKLHQMIERLLDAGRLHAHKELRVQEYPTRNLLQQVFGNFSASFNVINSASDDLPPVLADPDQISLAANAILESAKELPNCQEIDIQAQSHRKYVDIQITLKGDIAIEHYANFLEKMTGPKEIIAAHGGVFEVQHSSGAPIAIRFTLRRADATATDAAPTS